VAARQPRPRSREAPIGGRVEAGFERVAEAFRRNFARRGELGAAVCVYRHGEPVVDLWGGFRDAEGRVPWREDTLVLVFSATKGLTATAVHQLVEDGKLDLDAPVARYWPEFAQAAKERISLAWVLSHRAGIPAVDAALSTEQVLAGPALLEAIARQAPAWEPGTAHGYHPRTFGWILGEVVRRATGTSLGRHLAERVAAPLGLDLHLGLAEAHEPRVATLVPPEPPRGAIARRVQARLLGPGTLLGRALHGPGDLAYGEVWNTRALHAAELPSSNAIATAHALARHYAALIGEVDGVRLLDPRSVARARAPAVRGRDRLLLLRTRFGLGYMLPPSLGPGCGPESFGHPGAGGSLAFADPGARIAFGYAMNRMKLGLSGDSRSRALVEAVYACL